MAAAVADAWNGQAPAWWSSLHHDASQAVLRSVGLRPVLLARVWEKQQRGVLHVHTVLGYSTPSERAAAIAYGREVAAGAPAAGFGSVDHRDAPVLEPRAAAAYLSAYFVTGKGAKLTLQESVKSAQMPRSIVYVASWLSQLSGITMRSLRLLRFAWRVWKALFAADGDDRITPRLIWHNFMAGHVAPAHFASSL